MLQDMAESQGTFTWTEQNGIWRRKLGSMESFYAALAPPEGQPVHWMIACCVSISYLGTDIANIEDLLRQAWKTIPRGFSSVAAVVDPASRELVFNEGVTEEDWLQKSFKVHDDTSADELLSTLKSQFHITLHFLRRSNQLLIQSPHSLIDGRGILYLYHALFTALSRQSRYQPVEGLAAGPPNLTKPFDEWLGIPASTSERSLKDAELMFQRILQQQKPIQLPGVDFAAQPAKSVHRDLELTLETTSAIIDACKRKGVSVTSAFHAALGMATRKIQAAAGQDGASYAPITTIDLRRYFPASFVLHQHSIGSLECGIPFAADLSKDDTFEALSKSLQEQYKAPFAFADNDFGFLSPFTAISMQMLANRGVPPSSTPSLSSMGVVDDFLQERYGDWELENFWITSTMMTGDFQVYLWTFRGRMKFSACYNEAYYGTEQVDQVLESTRGEMCRGLGLV